MSDSGIPRRLLEAADISEITQLILRERESRDLGRWEAMKACFHPDSFVRVSWYAGNGPGFVEGSIDMARRGMAARHRLGPILVRLAADRAVASLGAIIDIPAIIDGVEAQLSSHTRFVYCAQRRAGPWKLFGFYAIYVRDELVASIPGETLRVPREALSGFRSSYRMLSYLLSLTGYSVDTELPGADRPGTAKALEAQLLEWADIKDW